MTSFYLVLLAASLALIACQPKSNSKPTPTPETMPETKPETKAETKPETKAETKPETKPETKLETKLAASIESFTLDPLPLLEAGQESIAMTLHWVTAAGKCSLRLGEESFDVTGKKRFEAKISSSVKAQLQCEDAVADLSIVVKKKLSLVSFTIQPTEGGEEIAWNAFGSSGCSLEDGSNGLNDKSQKAQGKLIIASANAPLNVRIQCANEDGQTVESNINVSNLISAADSLKIESFAGPSTPVKQLLGINTVAATFRWSVRQATACSIQGIALTSYKDEKSLDVAPGLVTLECRGARFQKATQTVVVAARKELRILKLQIGDSALYASSNFVTAGVQFQTYGADSCDIAADNARNAEDHRVYSDINVLEDGVIKQVPINRDSKEIKLVCSNAYQDKVERSLPITVVPRVEIDSFTLNPAIIRTSWKDTKSYKVQASWSVQNHEYCRIQIQRGNEAVTVKEFDATAAIGFIELLVNETTEITLACRDPQKLVHSKKQTLSFLRQPEINATASPGNLQIQAYGYDSCSISEKSIEFMSSVKAADKLEIVQNIAVPYSPEELEFTIACSVQKEQVLEKRVTVSTPLRYLYLRNAVIEDNSVQFEAAWDVGSRSQNCSLVQKDGEVTRVVLNGIEPRGQYTFQMPFHKASQIRMAVRCSESGDLDLARDGFKHPVAVCEEPIPNLFSRDALFDIPNLFEIEEYDMSCHDLFEKFQTVKNLDSIPLGLVPWAHFLGSVKTSNFSDIFNRESTLGYLGNLESLDYNFMGDQFDELHAVASLSRLKNFHLKLRRSTQFDGRFLKILPAGLRSFALTGNYIVPENSLPNFNESLASLELQELSLESIGIRSANLSSVLSLPLKKFSLRNVSCFQQVANRFVPFLGSRCLKGLNVNKKLNLTALTVDSSNVKDLDQIIEPTQVQVLEFYQSETASVDQPTWSQYKNLQSLKLSGVTSLSTISAGLFPGLKSLTLTHPKSARLDIAGLSAKFPAVENLSFFQVSLATLNSIWGLGLKELNLNSVTIDNWDLPQKAEAYQIPSLVMFWAGSVPNNGLKIGTLRVNSLFNEPLPTGVVQTLDLGQTTPWNFKIEQLTQQNGHVGSIILSPDLALKLQDLVKSCAVPRVTDGTTLVYSGFEVFWKACENL